MLAVVAVIGSVFGSEGDDRTEAPTTSTTTATRPPSTSRAVESTTTTSSTLPPLVLGETSGLLAVTTGGRVVVDLDTGQTWMLKVPVLAAHAGRILVNDGGLAWWRAPYDGTNTEPIAVEIQEPTPFPDPSGSVWLIDYRTARAVRVDVSGELLELASNPVLPSNIGVAGAVTEGLVLNAAGGTYLVDSAGNGTRRISTGAPFAVGGERIYVEACHDDFSCAIEVIEPDGDVVEVLPLINPSSRLFVPSPDGRVATAMTASGGQLPPGSGPDSVRAKTVSIDGDVVYDRDDATIEMLQWSPDGRWLFASGPWGVVAIDTRTGTAHEVPVPSGWQLAFTFTAS